MSASTAPSDAALLAAVEAAEAECARPTAAPEWRRTLVVGIRSLWAERERLRADVALAEDVTIEALQQLTKERDEAREGRGNWHDIALRTSTERDAYRAMVADLLASAFPNERDHPTMSKAWARARELLKNGKLNEPTAEQRKQEASIYLEEGLAQTGLLAEALASALRLADADEPDLAWHAEYARLRAMLPGFMP